MSAPTDEPSWRHARRAGEIVPLTLGAGGAAVDLYVAGGARPGPTLAVVAGVHGDEYEGPMAVARVLAALPVDHLAGTLLAVPVANPPAFAAGTRSSPLDGLNLARCFPGNPGGPPSMRLAALLDAEVIAPADALIDLHSGGVAYEMAQLAGYCDVGDRVGARSRELAMAFGAPVVWEHPEVAPGRTLSAAADHGIPSLYTEAGGGGGAPEEVVRCYVEGVQRVMTALGMLPEEPPAPRHRAVWRGSGNTDTAVEAGASGLFRSLVHVGDAVDTGAELGEILGYDGQVLERVTVPEAGVVAMVRRLPRVSPGDGLYLLTQRLDDR